MDLIFGAKSLHKVGWRCKKLSFCEIFCKMGDGWVRLVPGTFASNSYLLLLLFLLPVYLFLCWPPTCWLSDHGNCLFIKVVYYHLEKAVAGVELSDLIFRHIPGHLPTCWPGFWGKTLKAFWDFPNQILWVFRAGIWSKIKLSTVWCWSWKTTRKGSMFITIWLQQWRICGNNFKKCVSGQREFWSTQIFVCLDKIIK